MIGLLVIASYIVACVGLVFVFFWAVKQWIDYSKRGRQ